MRKLYLLFLIVCWAAVIGCDDNVDIGLVAEQLQAATQQEDVVQTSLPADVLAAMKIKADEMTNIIKKRLQWEDPPDWMVERNQFYIENGLVDVDFHALQKAFYTRYIDAGGIAIVGHDKVEDIYFMAARDIILMMTSKYPELRERLHSKHQRFYMVLVSEKEDFYDIPEMQTIRYIVERDFIPFNGFCTANTPPELKVVHTYCLAHVHRGSQPLSIFVHEFAHALEAEMERLKPGFKRKLEKANQEDLVDPFNSPSEYWAYGAEMWFGNGYEYLSENTPLLVELLSEWFPKVRYLNTFEIVPGQEIIDTLITWEIID